MKFEFNAKKSTQAAAFLLKKNGHPMSKYLWIKMLYLADRESLGKWEEPITGDSPASMPYGQVLSTIYDLTKGDCPSQREYWEQFITNSDEEERVSLKADPGVDELSKSEVAILESVFEKFHNYNFQQIHEYCQVLPEYEDVGKSSKPLPFERILKGLGRTDDQIRDAEKRCTEIRLAELLLG